MSLAAPFDTRSITLCNIFVDITWLTVLSLLKVYIKYRTGRKSNLKHVEILNSFLSSSHFWSEKVIESVGLSIEQFEHFISKMGDKIRKSGLILLDFTKWLSGATSWLNSVTMEKWVARNTTWMVTLSLSSMSWDKNPKPNILLDPGQFEREKSMHKSHRSNATAEL